MNKPIQPAQLLGALLTVAALGMAPAHAAGEPVAVKAIQVASVTEMNPSGTQKQASQESRQADAAPADSQDCAMRPFLVQACQHVE